MKTDGVACAAGGAGQWIGALEAIHWVDKIYAESIGRRGAGTRHSCANATLVPTEDALRKVVLKRKEAAIENCRNLRMF